jgi:hypothetical protein
MFGVPTWEWLVTIVLTGFLFWKVRCFIESIMR